MAFFRRHAPWIIGLTLLLISGVIAWLVFVGSSQDATWVAIGVAALASFFGAFSAVASLVQAFEAQKQREMSERPHVMVYFDSVYGGFLHLVITNVGNAPAVDVKIKFAPNFEVYTGQSVNDISLFQNPISFFPPGMIYRQTIGNGYKFLEEGKSTHYKAHLDYRTTLGEKISDSIEYDLEYLKDSHLPGKTMEKSLAEISDHLKNINGQFNQLRIENSQLVYSIKEYCNRLEPSTEDAPESES